MTDKISGLAFHCHHDTLIEYVWDFDERVTYIKSEKLENGVEIRLRLFKMLSPEMVAEIPENVRQAHEAWRLAYAVYRQAEEARERGEEVWRQADGVWYQAEEARERACKVLWDSEVFHKKWCGCAEWPW